METIDIFVYDHTFTPLGIIDHYESMIWTDRYYENGDFEIYLRMDESLIPFAQIGNYLIRHDTEHVMVIEKYEISCDYENGDYLILSGTSLEGLLNRRIIVDNFAFEGEFQTLIHKLLDENIISPVNDDRRIPGFEYRESSDLEFFHYSVTEDTTRDLDKKYYTKGYSSGGTIYVGFTGTEFESGVTYYERVVTGFVATSDREYKRDKTYYTVSETSTEIVYTEFAGKEFVSGTTYYEAVVEYPVTEDTAYDYTKRYYLQTEAKQYPEYTEFTGSSFEAGITYYELNNPLIKREYMGGENLYTAISDICQEQDVGFRIVLDDNYNFIFSLYQGLDRTTDQYNNEYVIFSPEFNNVVSSSFIEDSTTYKNVIYALSTNEDESDMEFGGGIGLSRREMGLDKTQFSVDAIDDSEIDSIVDDDSIDDTSDISHKNVPSSTIKIGSPTQYIGNNVWTTNRHIVGSSHTGSSSDVEHMSEWIFYNMWLKYPFSSTEDFKNFTFNLTYTKAMNAAKYVSGQIFTYGLGSNTAPGSNMKNFTWDTSAKQKLNCEIKGDFSANRTYYLWLCYNKGSQNNCYVEGVGVSNAQGVETSAEDSDIEVSTEYTKESTEQRAKEELENAKKTYTFDTEIDRVYTFAYRKNFELGDIVQVEDRYNHSAHARVTEVIESFDESGPASRPTFTVLEDTIIDDDSIGMYDDPIDI